jgi:coiled-coil domain-containing protein 55
MNINNSGKRKLGQVPKSDLEMGLNTRGGEGVTRSRNRLGFSALNGDDDSDEDNEHDNDGTNPNLSGREAVNHSIAKQQARIRAQAAAAAMSEMDASIYDYDGVYDSIHATDRTTTTTDSKKSRYIENLMKTAKIRKIERDIAYDRKVARDQQVEEEAEPEFRNKDRFITSSYKRQLEERHQYEQQESIKQQIEDQNDITKRSDGGFGIASFYGNITQQQTPSSYRDDAATGRNTRQTSSMEMTVNEKDKNTLHSTEKTSDLFQASSNSNHKDDTIPTSRPSKPSASTKDQVVVDVTNNYEQEHQQQEKSARVLREAKVQAARDRYFQRHPNRAKVVME